MNDSWRTIENPAIRDILRFVRTAEETGGEVTELDIQMGPRGGNPLHSHGSYTERFEVIEGTLGLQLGRTKMTLGEGENVVAEAGVPHRFFNPTDEPTHFRVELRAGHTGMEQSLRILYGLARDGQTTGSGMPKNPQHVALIADISEMKPAGLMAALNPLLGALARRARAKGLDEELLARYCTPPAS